MDLIKIIFHQKNNTIGSYSKEIVISPPQNLRITFENVRWCNGNTADFGSAFLGSNPSRTTLSLA